VSGMTRPEAVVVSASLAWTRILSSSGLMFTLATLSPPLSGDTVVRERFAPDHRVRSRWLTLRIAPSSRVPGPLLSSHNCVSTAAAWWATVSLALYTCECQRSRQGGANFAADFP